MTAQSEPINIPLETKIEVVKTLVSYPLVLDELLLTEQLLESKTKLNTFLEVEVSKQSQIIANLEKSNDLLKKQLQKQKLKGLKIAGVGVLAIVGAFILKN